VADSILTKKAEHSLYFNCAKQEEGNTSINAIVMLRKYDETEPPAV
jgi:hypothetical protein